MAATVETPKKLLRQEAYGQLKRQILRGQIPAGTFLSERRLVEELGMSKTPIRVALERLESEGYVGISPSQGIVVCEPSIHELVDIMELRQVIESHVVSVLAQRLTASQKAELSAQLEAQRESVQRQDIHRHVELDVEFHIMLSRFVGNKELHRTMLQLHDKTMRVVMQVARENYSRLPENLAEHQGIAEAIIAGSGPEAVARLRKHLEYGRNFLMSRGRF